MFEGDIRDNDLLKKVCKGASIVFHTASIIDVTGAVEYGELFGVNVKGEGLFELLSLHVLFSLYLLICLLLT